MEKKIELRDYQQKNIDSLKKEMYSKENIENVSNEILEVFSPKYKRPDLSYLTQQVFNLKTVIAHVYVNNDKNKAILNWHKFDDNSKFALPISKLPELVQCAEMLFDMTLSNPNSITHKIVSDLLNELKP
jgi:hypothetical protein